MNPPWAAGSPPSAGTAITAITGAMKAKLEPR